MSTTTSTRLSAAERREAVLEAAIAVFAAGGLRGASTEDIAAAAGISQPYLFKLFGTKKELFVAVVQRCFRRTLEAFQLAAAQADPDDVFRRMGLAYLDLLEDRNKLLVQLQAYVACDDPDVCDAVRRGFGELWSFVERVSGRSEDEVRQFFATGMLINVQAAMDLQAVKDDWARRCLYPGKNG